VTIEWKDVDGLTPWRTGLAFATGIEPPQDLREGLGRLCRSGGARADAALATRAPQPTWPGRGILSSAAMVDLYSQVAAIDAADGAVQDKTWGPLAAQLRTAYVATDAGDRLAAIKALWGSPDDPDRAYSRLVLTAYAAARMVPSQDLAGDARRLIASMLTAGLDANAARWGAVVPAGSEAWGLIAGRAGQGAVINGDVLDSSRARTTAAGLALAVPAGRPDGLGRIDDATGQAFAGKLKVDSARHALDPCHR
jgi:hypothetical protein